MAFDDEVEKQILHHCFNCWPCDVDFVWRNPSCLLFSLSSGIHASDRLNDKLSFYLLKYRVKPPHWDRQRIHENHHPYYLCPFLVRPICPFLSILCLFCFHGRSTNNLLIHIHVPVYQIINPKSRKIAREVDLEFNPS